MKPDLKALEGIRLKDDEPIFSEPWEAQAFAMTIALFDKGLFTWSEWANTLSAHIHSGNERTYYQHWLAALEAISVEKSITDQEALARREQEWHEAAARTPHGEPIEL